MSATLDRLDIQMETGALSRNRQRLGEGPIRSRGQVRRESRLELSLQCSARQVGAITAEDILVEGTASRGTRWVTFSTNRILLGGQGIGDLITNLELV